MAEALRRWRAALRDWRRIAREVACIAEALHPGAKVYVFGSAARGDYTAASDIDILVLVDEDPRKAYIELMNAIWELENSELIDLHVAKLQQTEEPPYTWLVRGAEEVGCRG